MYLAAPKETIGLTAGIEDGLSVVELFQVPMMAVIGDGNIPNAELPEIVNQVELYVDNDTSGDSTYLEAKEVFEAQGLEVVNKQAPFPYKDWNEVLKARKRK